MGGLCASNIIYHSRGNQCSVQAKSHFRAGFPDYFPKVAASWKDVRSFPRIVVSSSDTSNVCPSSIIYHARGITSQPGQIVRIFSLHITVCSICTRIWVRPIRALAEYNKSQKPACWSVPHDGVRPFHQTTTCLTQSTLGPCVV